jgi:branched-chain amino acid transport system substrate-binding protein
MRGADEEAGRGLSRRDFMARAGASGAVLLTPGLLAACGSDDDEGGGGGEAGETIKIGYVTPRTGALAPFGEADEFVLGQIRKAFANGIDTPKGKLKVQIVVKDSQSTANRAGTVASDLILKDKVDLVLVSSTPDTTNPVSDQCELNGVPCISAVAPWQSWFFGRKGDPEKPFQWTYHFFWGVEDLNAVYLDMWGQVDTNKKVGALWPNDADGNALSNKETGQPPAITKEGYTITDPGRYANGTTDFSAQINRFRSAGDEVLVGCPIPPDFTTFYKQAAQQGFRPAVASIAKAILFPSAVDALGEIGEGLSTEVWWSPSHPFKSSITGASSQEVADAFIASTNKQWTQPIGFAHALFEVARDVFGRATDAKDKQAVADAIKATEVDTIVGPISWKNGPVPNVAKTPLTGGQWVKGEKFPYDLVLVSNSTAEDIPTAAELKPIS